MDKTSALAQAGQGKEGGNSLPCSLFSPNPWSRRQATEGVSETTAKVSKRLGGRTPERRLKEVGGFDVIKKRRYRTF